MYEESWTQTTSGILKFCYILHIHVLIKITFVLYIFPPGSVPQYGIGVIPKDEVQK